MSLLCGYCCSLFCGCYGGVNLVVVVGCDWWQRNEKVGDVGRGGGFCVREQQGAGRIGVAVSEGCGFSVQQVLLLHIFR